jgi:uncharacterized membrane protein
MVKSATFGLVHLGIAFGVSLLLTGDLIIAGAITLVEPIANMVAHYFFDRWWERRRRRGSRRPGVRAASVAAKGAS